MRNSAFHRLLGLALLCLVPVSAHAQQAASSASLRGDVDGDGRVSAADAQAVRDHVAGRPARPGITILPNGDANGDGRITGVDAAMIQAFAAGRDVSRFGVGKPLPGGTGGTGGGERAGGTMMVAYECTVDVDAGTQSCQQPRPTGDARMDMIAGKAYVTYITTGAASFRGDATNEDTTVMNVAIQNLMDHPIGTLDGVTPHPNGNRVFLHSGPTVTAVKSGTLASATIRMDNADGTADFTGPDGSYSALNRKYYQYNGVLAKNAASAPKLWRFVFSANTRTFSYRVYVSAPVQYEFGRIAISPASQTLGVGETGAALTASVADVFGATVPDAVVWTSSDPLVATVDPVTGAVTGVKAGTATITATSTSEAQRTGSITVTVDAAPTVVSTTPTDGATNISVTDNVTVTFSEAVDATSSSFTLACPTGSAQGFTVSGSGTATLTLDPTAYLPAGVTCTATVLAAGIVDTDTNDGPNALAADYTFTFETVIRAVDDTFGETVLGNVAVSSANASPAFSVTANDQLGASTTITAYGWGGTAGKTLSGGEVVMDTEGEGMGQFTYNPPAGFEGADSLEYTVTQGGSSSKAKVGLTVSGMIWFINNRAGACAAACDGRLSNPFPTIAAYETARTAGGAPAPAGGDAVFIYESGTAYAGPITLQTGQKLIGQDAGAALTALTGLTPPPSAVALPGMNPGLDTVKVAGTDGVNLGTNNSLFGMTLMTAAGAGQAISGTSFGTLTLAATPDLIIKADGQALSLTTGAIAGTFVSVGSAGGTHNVLLSGVSGDIDFGAGTLSGSTGGAVKIVGGPLTLDASGSITQSAVAPLLDVSGAHTGTLTFTGTLNAAQGTGLQFSDADGTYTFGGTTTLNGGDAAIDITGGSGGTFAFASGTAVTNPTGTAFGVASSTPNVTFNGNLTKNAASPGLLVDISGQASGTITFATGALSGTSSAGTGIQLSDADGTVSFNGGTTLTGGDNGIDIIGGSGGTITFGTGTGVTNPSGTAFRVASSAPGVTFNGNLTKDGTSAGLLVDISGQASGTITFATGTLTGTSTAGTGIQLSDADGNVAFNGTTTLANGDNGIDVIGGSSGTVTFNANTSITNPSGNVVQIASSAPAFTYSGSFTKTGANAGILVNANTGGTATFEGVGKTRTLNTTTGHGVSLTSNSNTTVDFKDGGLLITTTSGNGFNASSNSGTGTVSVRGAGNTITSSTSGTALTFQNTTIGATGLTFQQISAGNANGDPDPANGIVLNTTGSTGSLTVTGTGSAGTGGTIRNTTGGDGTTNGIGIYLNNTRSPSFSWMQLNDHAGWGIRGVDVVNLTLANVVVNGTNGTDVNTDEGAVFFTNLSGSASITNSAFSGGAEDNFRVFNTGGTLNRITFTTVNFGANSTAGGNDALLLQGRGSSVLNATITGSTFTSSRGDLFQYLVEQQATGDLVFTGNTLSNNHPNITSNGGGVTVTSGGDPTTDGSALTYNISNNTLRGSRGAALVVQKLAGHGTASGTVSGNQIGVTGQIRSGSIEASGISMDLVGAGSHTTTISNNIIRQYRDHGIYVQTGNSVAGGGNNGRMVATITNNTVSERAVDAVSNTFFPGNGIRFVNGNVNTDVITACLTITGNSVTGQGVSPQSDIRVWDRWAANTFALPGLGAATADASIFVKNNNGGTPSVTATSPDQFTTSCP